MSCIQLKNTDLDIVQLIQAILLEGYTVKTFTESREAQRHIIELNNPMYYQLAIIDIRMLDINGVQLYQTEPNSGIKVLFVSALDAVEELMSIFPDIKSKDIIREPITEERLIAKHPTTN